jgi:hypothetical protein
MLNTHETQTVRRSRLTAMAGGISLALATLPGAAVAAPSAWEGFATITAATPQCSGINGTGTGAGVDGTATGAIHVSIFRPKIAITDSPTFLSFVFLRAALTLENASEATVPQMNGSGNYTGFGIGSRAGFGQYAGTYNLTVVPATITAATPATISAVTDAVAITGTITNFFNTTGCNVTFEGVYVQRID